MEAIVVFESLWGNTAAVARAIAEGIGPEARAVSTAEASAEVIADADIIVAGAPVLAFRLPTDRIRNDVGAHPERAPEPPNLSHPSMRSWLEALPEALAGAAPEALRKRRGYFAAFETRIWWSPGGSTKAIERGLERAGYRRIAARQRFIVTGAYGPLRDGELERARLWGQELAEAVESQGAKRAD